MSLVALCGCTAFDDALFYGWDDRRVLCAQSVDDIDRMLDVPRILGRMDDAAMHGHVYNIYANVPEATVSSALLERLLGEAARRNLSFVTYPDLLDRSDPRAGLALSFDDESVAEWSTLRDLLLRYDARVTFFVTAYHRLSAQARAQLKELAADGHAIEAHGVDHLDATQYVAAHGLEAYLRDEALPSIDRLLADGYPASVFAYPFGARNDDIDRALLEHVALVRTTAGPCPR